MQEYIPEKIAGQIKFARYTKWFFFSIKDQTSGKHSVKLFKDVSHGEVVFGNALMFAVKQATSSF